MISKTIQVVFCITANNRTEEGNRGADENGKTVNPQYTFVRPFWDGGKKIEEVHQCPCEQYP